MIGENIKRLRTQKGLTQKGLADQLFVTAQAVSRWENGEVEPSIVTISQMSKIFEVSTDEILGVESTPKPKEPEVVTRTEYVVRETPPVLGVCETCNKPIYDPNEIVRFSYNASKGHSGGSHVYCKKCVDERNEREKQRHIDKSISRRRTSFVLGGLAAAVCIALGIVAGIQTGKFVDVLPWLGIGIAAFTYISCCLLANNFIGEMTLTIFSWGFVKMPGLIFELDLDGIVWLLTVKLLFWIAGIALALAFGLLGIILGGALSLFVYPFAIKKNFQHPEEINID